MALNWSINVIDVLMILGVGFTLYGRFVSLETRVELLWDEFSEKQKGNRR